MAEQSVTAMNGEDNQTDPRLERMEELRNEFVALGFDIHWKTDPGGITNLCMAAIGVSMDATRAICAELLKKTKPPQPEPQKTRRSRKPKGTASPAWAKNIEGVAQ